MSQKILVVLLVTAGFILNIFALDVYDTINLNTTTVYNEDVHIYPGGVIQNEYGIHVNLTINGNLINEGTLQRNTLGYDLHLTLNGDLSNSGILNPRSTTISGSVAHNISASNPITTPQFTVTNSAGLIANGDIAFNDCDVDFNDYLLDITGGYDISVDGGSFTYASVEGLADISVINLTNSAYIGYTDLNNMIFTGTHDIYYSNSIRGKSVNNRIFQSYSGIHPIMTIEDDFTNNGSIINNGGYNLTIDCFGGTITNDGTWSNYFLNFKGTTDQN
ncbi:MAG: hypothetical protein GQ534_10125, partial [Candidatus Delongbacteria bacterium]|nr:hypothetical protein [Candidatus Delongbacteria bacterium]